jgi:hypothetical protein
VGETQNRPFQLSFNSSLKVDFQGSRVTSDGGLILVLQTPWCRCDCESELKMEIPVNER